MNQPKFSPALGIGIAVIALSFPAIFIRLANQEAATETSNLGFSLAFWRLAIASAILWPIAGKSVKPAFLELKAAERWQVLAAGAFLGIHLALWITSVLKTTVASASFLVITQPVFVAVLAHFLLQERLNRWSIIALFLTLAGSGLINFGDLELGAEYLWGDFLALIAAIMVAFYYLAGRSVRRNIRILPYITLVYSVAALVVLIFCLAAGSPLISLPPKMYFWCLMLALIPTLIGHSLFNWALRYLKAFTVNASIIVEPLGATIMAWVFFREQPNAWLYPGAVLLIAALLFAFRGERA